MQRDPAQASVGTLVSALYLSAAVTLVAAIALGLLISPVLFGLAAIALLDLVVAGLFARGAIGPLAARRRGEASGDAAIIAEDDPSYNPYARED